MRITYGKLNIIVLFLCIVAIIGLLASIKNFYLDPLKLTHAEANNQLSSAQNLYQTLLNQKEQLEDIEGISFSSEELTTLIPVDSLRPESLLTTFSDLAQQTDIIITEQQFQADVPMTSQTEDAEEDEEEEESQSPSLMKTIVTLRLEGDNEDQFQEFVQLLEGVDRLIQVETFTLEQTMPANTMAAATNEISDLMLPVTFDWVQPMVKPTGGEVELGGDSQKEESPIDSEANGDGETEGDKNPESDTAAADSEEKSTSESELDSDSDSDSESTPSEEAPSSPQATMRATITVAIYHFES